MLGSALFTDEALWDMHDNCLMEAHLERACLQEEKPNKRKEIRTSTSAILGVQGSMPLIGAIKA
jgi:hypothetical protein